MFLEKFARFFRRYKIRISSRAKYGPSLPLVAKAGSYSVIDALSTAKRANKLIAKQPNGDDVELVVIDTRSNPDAVVLLFVRSSPDAADPSYLKKLRGKVSLRHASKLAGEDQAVSAHLVIQTKPSSPSVHEAALEEIPGISMSTIYPILAIALRDYRYTFKNGKGEEQETYCILKPEGIKSEALSATLKKKGSLDYLVLTRTAAPNAPDSEGIAEPMNERIKYKIVGDPRSVSWRSAFDKFVKRARDDSWDDVSIQISLEDDRHRTVKVDRTDEASEILFVRSEQVTVRNELKP